MTDEDKWIWLLSVSICFPALPKMVTLIVSDSLKLVGGWSTKSGHLWSARPRTLKRRAINLTWVVRIRLFKKIMKNTSQVYSICLVHFRQRSMFTSVTSVNAVCSWGTWGGPRGQECEGRPVFNPSHHRRASPSLKLGCKLDQLDQLDLEVKNMQEHSRTTSMAAGRSFYN